MSSAFESDLCKRPDTWKETVDTKESHSFTLQTSAEHPQRYWARGPWSPAETKADMTQPSQREVGEDADT